MTEASAVVLRAAGAIRAEAVAQAWLGGTP
jgi:hypothetical protein